MREDIKYLRSVPGKSKKKTEKGIHEEKNVGKGGLLLLEIGFRFPQAHHITQCENTLAERETEGKFMLLGGGKNFGGKEGNLHPIQGSREHKLESTERYPSR